MKKYEFAFCTVYSGFKPELLKQPPTASLSNPLLLSPYQYRNANVRLSVPTNSALVF